MPAVPIGEGVDGDKIMMEPDRDFVWRKCFVVFLVANVVEFVGQFGSYPVGFNTDVAFG